MLAIVGIDSKRGILQITSSKGLYAIRYSGEEDLEGEIADLTGNESIEMSPGDEVCIRKNLGDEAGELWFYLDSSRGNIEAEPRPSDRVPVNHY